MATESGRAKQAICALASATRTLGPLCFLLLASGQATAAAEPWRLGEALKLPERLTLSGDFRARYEYLDSQFRAGEPGDDQILVLRTRVLAGLRITDWLSVAAEFQDSRAYLEDDNTPLGTGTVNAAELLRAYLLCGAPIQGDDAAGAGARGLDPVREETRSSG